MPISQYMSPWIYENKDQEDIFFYKVLICFLSRQKIWCLRSWSFWNTSGCLQQCSFLTTLDCTWEQAEEKKISPSYNQPESRERELLETLIPHAQPVWCATIPLPYEGTWMVKLETGHWFWMTVPVPRELEAESSKPLHPTGVLHWQQGNGNNKSFITNPCCLTLSVSFYQFKNLWKLIIDLHSNWWWYILLSVNIILAI